jgi:transposase-like protein
MPVEIDGQLYYRTAEVYRELGISRNTLYRWLQKDILGATEHRDVRGWRLFTIDEIDAMKKSINQVVMIEHSKGK